MTERGTAAPGIKVAAANAEEGVDHQHDQNHGQDQGNSASRSEERIMTLISIATARWAAPGIEACSCGSIRPHPIDGVDDVGAGLARDG